MIKVEPPTTTEDTRKQSPHPTDNLQVDPKALYDLLRNSNDGTAWYGIEGDKPALYATAKGTVPGDVGSSRSIGCWSELAEDITPFPNYRRVVPDKVEAVEHIRFNAEYMLRICKAAIEHHKLTDGSKDSDPLLDITFSGEAGGIILESVTPDGTKRGMMAVLMPVRRKQ